MLTTLMALALAPQALADRAEDNVVAFAKLAGVVQYFHTADGAIDLDWDRFLIENVTRVENARDPEQLAAMLEKTFQRFAPTVQVWAGGLDEAPEPIAVPRASHRRGIEHIGLGPEIIGLGQEAPPQQNIYWSRVIAVGAQEEDDRIPEPGAMWVSALGAGVSARVPLSAPADETKTLPETQPTKMAKANRARDWKPVIAFRKTRAAAVIGLYNLLRHFYPYWDVVEADWDTAFVAALRKSALDEDEIDFMKTLRAFLAVARDGHGNLVAMRPNPKFGLPFEVVILDGQVVVSVVRGAEGVSPGDRVVAINGRDIENVVEEEAALISASSPGWRNQRLAMALWISEDGSPAEVSLESLDGEVRTHTFERTQLRRPPIAQRPGNGDELAPGIVYFNLVGAETSELEKHLDTLAAAPGVVFDLRGYPSTAGARLLEHLTDEPIHSAWWNVPHYRYPDQRDVEFKRSHWTLEPREPRIEGQIAFLTGGSAISYAESCLGIVEHYRLGEIVGAPTAGTNGNINRRLLPGYTMVIWTGMKVTKQDDSQHHGVGIRPTVPVRPTRKGLAAGRDEVLEKAIEVLSTKLGK